MAERNLMDLAKQAARTAQREGSRDARVFLSRSRSVSVEWRDGKLDRIQESTSLGMNVELYVDGRYSANSSSDLRPAAIDDYIRTAVATTRFLAPDEHRKLPEPARYEGAPAAAALDRHDASVSGVTPQQRLQTARQLEEAARAGDGSGAIVSVTTWVGDTENLWVGLTTNGLEATETGTSFSLGADVSVKDKDDRKPSGWDMGETRFLADLPAVGDVGRTATRRAVDQLGSKQVETGEYELVVENRAVPTFVRHLLSPLFGQSIQQKRSFMEGMLDKEIGSRLLTVTSDPHLPRGLASTAFDGEGMATSRRPILEGGVLRTYFLDTYYASKLGMAPTTTDTGNLVWQAGTRDAAAMVAGMSKGIFVTGFLGGNSNGTTGDFSLGIKGLYVEKGKIVHPVSEMNAAGNHLEFWRRLAEVGSDPWAYSSNRAPSLRFEGVQCSGA
jgi:PmbA protein